MSENFPDGDEYLTQDEVWQVIGSFFEQSGLVQQQIRSYDSFISEQIDVLVRDLGEIELHQNQLNHAIGEDNDQPSSILIHFDNVKLARLHEEPQGIPMTPHAARLRQLTYGLRIFADCQYKIYHAIDDTQVDETENSKDCQCEIGVIPLMVRSNFCVLHKTQYHPTECQFDPGGYFIVNGSEKVIIGQEHMLVNRPIVFSRKSLIKYDLIAQLRSQPASCAKVSQPFEMYIVSPTRERPDRTISCKLPKMSEPIPLPIVFRALGVVHDKEILEHVCYDMEDAQFLDVLRPTLEDNAAYDSQQLCFDFIARHASFAGTAYEQRTSRLNNIFNNLLLPHIGEQRYNISAKAYYIGYVCNLLVQTYLRRRREDDRDHYSNKRIDLAGPLIASMFGQLFQKQTKEISKRIQREARTIDFSSDFSMKPYVSNLKTVTDGIKFCIATGNWNSERKAVGSKVGVSQQLNRLTYISTLSNLRRVTTPIERDAKLTRPRHLHNTHWGYICPVETPEGAQTGLVKNFALMALVTVDRDTEPIYQMLDEVGVQKIHDIPPSLIQQSTKVFINGNWYGVHQTPSIIHENLIRERRKGYLPFDVSIIHNIAEREIFIWADGGRVTRPLLVVEDMKPVLTRSSLKDLRDDWEAKNQELFEEIQNQYPNLDYNQIRRLVRSKMKFKLFLKCGMIEYLDVDEEENAMIAMTQDVLREESRAENPYCTTYTHCEIHPSMILSVSGSLIPFPDHNQSPRNCYQCAMGKQAIGLYATNFQQRMDSSCHVLWYPQKPLVTTHAMEYVHFKEMPAGINVVIAVCCYTGYNQEDSLMLNQSSIDRGLFRSFYFRTYTEKAGKDEQFMIPKEDEVREMRYGNKLKLDDDGLARIGERVTDEDCLIGKVSKVDPTMADHRTWKDESVNMRTTERGIVDLVMASISREEDPLVRVRTRLMRTPQLGDKFSSRHGQKGTCGMTYRQEDMPFTRDGIVPDIIMNPHALPSRMTIGQLIECLLGKVAANKGIEGNATPFTGIKVEDISNKLKELGYESHGNEVLYNGRTGRKLRGKIYFGPTFYQRLKHMVADKMHARATGPVTLILRQPLEGRAKNGGLRFGEMERDCLIAHGVSAVIRDRLFENSDRYTICVCKNCGMLAYEDTNGERVCKACKGSKEKAKFALLEIPYAFKIVIQELMSMCIYPRLTVD